LRLDDAAGRRRPLGVVAGQPAGVGFVARRLLGHVIGGWPPGYGLSRRIGGKATYSLTPPGAVSLGAYEGGALAALLLACQELGE
jgi:hypothetical protein